MFLKRILLLGTILSLGVNFPIPVKAESTLKPELELSQQSVSESKRKLIRELIEITGGEKLFRQVSQISATQLQQESLLFRIKKVALVRQLQPST